MPDKSLSGIFTELKMGRADGKSKFEAKKSC